MKLIFVLFLFYDIFLLLLRFILNTKLYNLYIIQEDSLVFT